MNRNIRASVLLLCCMQPTLKLLAQEQPSDSPNVPTNVPTNEPLPAPVTPATDTPSAPVNGDDVDDARAATDPESTEEQEAEACTGTAVYGVVRDASTQETLIEAPVNVLGANGHRTTTDELGNYRIALTAGTYALRARYDFYQPLRVDRIVVREGECTEVNFDLSSEELTANEMVVQVRPDSSTTAATLRDRRESAAAQDGVSAEEVRRSADSDAGQAARRVVGASVVGGQYLFVRGLGGRYTLTLLNHALVPSTDPDQPGVQLDLFPASMLNGLTVQKTYTPDLPGDATGGALLLATRDFPTQFTLRLSGSLGFNTATTFSNAPSGQGGSADALGFDDGSRALPVGVSNTRPLLESPSFSADQVQRASRAFAPSWRIGDQLALPNGRLSVTVGDRVHLFGRPLGYTLNVLYSHSTQVLRGERVSRVYLADPDLGTFDAIPERQRTSTTDSAQWGALGAARLELAQGSHLTLSLLWSQAADAYTGVLTGYDAGDDQNTRQSRVRWVERSLYFSQLSGEHEHVLGTPATLRWMVSGSMGSRYEPDTRDLLYVSNRGDENYFWRSGPGSGERLFLNLDQREVSASADLSIPIQQVTVRFGGLGRVQGRDFQMRRFLYQAGSNFDNTNAALAPQDLFSRPNIGPDLYLRETTGGRDGYGASQELWAAFVMADWKPSDNFRLIGGIRGEGFVQSIVPRSPFDTTQGENLRRTDVDPIPALQAVIGLGHDVFLRPAFSSTVARPQLRELAPFLYPDFVRLRNILGNSGLRRTRIHNFDVRLEWFPTALEVVAATAFAKAFEAPIESVAYANNTFSFDNVQGANVFGAELEGRLQLSRLGQLLNGLEASANLTLATSSVTLSEAQRQQTTNLSRPMAGQSPWVVNVAVGYARDGVPLRVRLIYNVFGPRIIEVGRERLPDIYQDEFHSLDLAASYALGNGFELKASVENLLHDDFVLRQGGHVVQQYQSGLTASIGLELTTH